MTRSGCGRTAAKAVGLDVLLILLILVAVAAAQEAVFNTIVDADQYVVGPGDRFRIDFWSGSTPPFEVTVTPEGYVLMNSIGRVEVGGLTLHEARTKMKNQIRNFSADGEYTVTLVQARPVKILISSGVAKPGLYDALVSQRVSEVIKKADGLIPGASHRNIRLTGGNTAFRVDLLKYEKLGDLAANPYLYCGYVIEIPMIVDSSSFVQVSGEVVGPGGFEYREGDNLGTFLRLAGGCTGNQEDSARIYRDGELLFAGIADSSFAIKAADKIVVAKGAEKPEMGFYSVVGEVLMPGRYPYEEGLSLEAALRRAAGLTSRGDIYSLTIFRKMPIVRKEEIISVQPPDGELNAQWEKGSVPVSLAIDELSPDKLSQVGIFPGDSILVPPRSGQVIVHGFVNRPGTVPYGDAKMSLAQAVRLAGGYSAGADRSMMAVTRKSSGVKIRGSGGTIVHDGDIINVPEKVQKKTFLEKVRDMALIAGGAGIVYLAIDNMAE